MHRKQSRFFILSTLCAGISGAVIGAASGFADIKEKSGQTGAKTAAAAAGPERLALKGIEQKQGNALKQAGGNGAASSVKNAASDAHNAKTLPGAVAKTPLMPPAADGNAAAAAGKEKILAGAEGNARGVLNGYKGYRYHRSGYKSAGDGWWYPRAAFARKSAREPFMQKPGKWAKTAQTARGNKEARKAAGLTGKDNKDIASGKRREPAKPALTTAHKSWCAAHYPSYRLRDNSYSTAAGKRKICLSSYMEK